jgi:nitroreductase/NAD-dependent dihydropyrimidine dehydrogenase PreA subunit
MKITKSEDKCIDCLRCVASCVSGVWRETEGKSVVAAAEDCNGCAHCVAICPSDAITHEISDEKQLRPIDKKKISADAYWEMAVSRRSVRNFGPKIPSRETIERILEIARYSPTATNSQNLKIIVVENRETLELLSKRIFGFAKGLFTSAKSPLSRKLLGMLGGNPLGEKVHRYIGGMEYYIEQSKSGRDFILHNAPALILVLAPKNDLFSKDNCNIAATNIANFAHASGLGSCFIGFLTLALRYSKDLAQRVGVPDGYEAYASLVIGYPEHEYKKTVSRKELDVTWLG